MSFRRKTVVAYVQIILLFSVFVYAQTENQTLEAGKPFERELKGGESHSYTLTFAAKQFLFAAAEQKGIDVVLTLYAPDGKKIIEIDSPNGTSGEEPLFFISETAGDYRLEVRSLENNAPAGRYEVKIVELRNAVANDKYFVAAARAMSEAELLTSQNKQEVLPQAIEKYKQAAELFRQAEKIKPQARALANIAEIYQFQPDYKLSIEYNRQALKLYEAANAKEESGVILARLGEVYDGMADFLQAAEYYRRAIVISEAINDKRTVAIIENNWGLVHQALGNFEQATNSYFRALKIAEEINFGGIIAAALNNLGNIFQMQGNYARALEFQQRQLALVKSWNAAGLIPRALQNIGIIYHDQENHELALQYGQNALDAYKKINNTYGMAMALNNIGIIYMNRGEYEKALDYFNKSAQIKNENGITDPATIDNIGLVYNGQGYYDKAIEYFQKSLEISKDKDPNAASYLANTYAAKGDFAKSLEFSNRAIQIARRVGLNKILSTAYTTAGKANLALGKPEEAKQNFLDAVFINENMRLQVAGGNEQKAEYFEQSLEPYYSLVALLVSQNKANEAFTVAEQTKSRTLLDVLQSGKLDVRKAMTAKEQETEKLLKNELVSLNAQITKENSREKPEPTRLADLQSRLQKKRLEFEDFQIRLYAAHPELKVQRGEMKPISPDEATTLLPDDKSALLEFVVAQDKSFLFVLDKDQNKSGVSLKVFPIDIKQSDLAQRTENFRVKLAKGDLDFAGEAQDLYNLLLKPAEAQLKNKTNLIIVPDASLWDLPFQALQPAPNKYLIEQAAVSYAPSLTALREMTKKNQGKKFSGATLLAFGNPTVGKDTSERIKKVFLSERLEPLPESQRMVNSLKQMYGANRSKVFVGADAREEIAKFESSKYRIVQFAAHGILNDASPMYSHIVLAQQQDNPNEDGLLEAWEMKDLNLNAEMVILSACETARGRFRSGEGVIGMSWALFIAGAPTTVASQWKVESSSTTELMLEFHRQLLTGKNISKAEALRQASLKLLKMPQYKHPSYWAGFVMLGDGF